MFIADLRVHVLSHDPTGFSTMQSIADNQHLAGKSAWVARQKKAAEDKAAREKAIADKKKRIAEAVSRGEREAPEPPKPLTPEQMARRREYFERRDQLQARAEDARQIYIEHRLEHGYVWSGAGAVGGYHQEAFTYSGLRSSEHPHLRAFMAMLSAPGKLRSGDSKAFLLGGGDTKLAALDAQYVEGNKVVRGFIRSDLDKTFRSWGHLRDELRYWNLPMPHIGVGAMMTDGAIYHPHLIWMLPPNNGIRFDKLGRKAPQKLFNAIHRGIADALIPLGGDPGGTFNKMRVKNPLSPHWSVAILNESMPLTLAELGSWFDLNIRTDQLIARHAEHHGLRDGIPAVVSNSLFNEYRSLAFQRLQEWHRRGDHRLTLEDRENVAQALLDDLEPKTNPIVEELCQSHAQRTLTSVCRFSAEAFDPEKIGSYRPNAGILRESLKEVRSVKHRQQAGARHSATARKQRSLDDLVLYFSTMASDILSGTKTRAQIARDIGIDESTLRRRWDEAIAMLPDEHPMKSVPVKRRKRTFVEVKEKEVVVRQQDDIKLPPFLHSVA